MLFWYSSWVRISSSECPNAVLTFELSEYQVLKCYFDIFWHSSWVIITLDDFSSILFNLGCFDIRAESKYQVLYAKMLFWHSSWVIFRHYSTRGYLSFSAKKPIFDFVWDRDKNHCLGTYMFCLGWIFMKRADNQNRDTVLDVFDCEPDQTFHYRVICPRVPKAYIRHCQFSFNQILWTWLAGNQGVCDEIVTRHAYVFVTPVKNSCELFTHVKKYVQVFHTSKIRYLWRIHTY